MQKGPLIHAHKSRMFNAQLFVPENAQLPVVVVLLGDGPHPGAAVLAPADEHALVRAHPEAVDAANMASQGLHQLALTLLAKTTHLKKKQFNSP